jgi:signal transduction histidine kinase
MKRMNSGDNVSHDDERVSQVSPRLPHASDRRAGAPWLVARSAGEILALAALFLSAVALVVVLDDADAPGSLREQAGLLLVRLVGQANVATAIALVVALVLAAALVLAVRTRDQACARADRLARDLGSARRQIEQLKSALAARDELLLAVVHELRTPLTHVVGYAELLSSGARPRHPREIGEMSAAIQSASTTMLRLMDDLVEATRAQAEGFGLKTRPVDLVHLIRGVVAGYDVQQQAHRLTLDLPDHWLAVLADPERVHQVLANLLTNAISYSPDGSEIRVRARALGDQVRVEIEDHGIGMAPEDQRRAFDRFYRASEGRALREHGSGLGLAIVKDLVEAHGGQVGVASQRGVGSTFWFTLRTADDRPAGVEASVPAHQAAPATPSA